MKKLLKWLLLIVSILGLGIAVVLYNPNLAKGPFERRLGKATGYGLSLEGDLDLSVGRSIELSVADLHVAAPDWSANDDLAVIRHLRLRLNSASLFSGIPIVEELHIRSVNLNLEVDADGNGNWIPPHTTAPGDDPSPDPAVLLNDVRVDDATLVYVNAQRDLRHVLHIESLSQQQRSDGMLEVSLRGGFNDRPVAFSGSLGPYQNLLEGRQVSYRGQGNFGSMDIRGQGLVDDLASPRRPQFELHMQGADIDEITAMLGADDLGSGVFSLRALGGMNQDRYEAGISGEIGDVTLNLALEADDLMSLSRFDLQLAANGPSLGALTRVFGIRHWPDEPFSLTGRAQRIGQTLDVSGLTLGIGGSRMTLDALLNNFPALDASRVKLNLSGDDMAQFRDLLGFRGIASGPFEVNGRLDVSPGEVELIQVDVATSLGRMTLNGTLGDAPDYTGSRLHLYLEGEDANHLMKALGIDALPAEPFSLDTRLLKTEDGLEFEKGVLVTIQDERLELGGFVSLDAGGRGSDVELNVTGQHLGSALGRVLGGVEFSDLPYGFSGRVRVLDEGIRFDGFNARVAGVTLGLAGILKPQDEEPNGQFEFQLAGEDFAAIGDVVNLGNSMHIFTAGQAYTIDGVLGISDRAWELPEVEARIGDTRIGLSGMISNQAGHAGTYFEYALSGPDLNGFVTYRDASGLPVGAFESSGVVRLDAGRLGIENLIFETPGIHGQLDLQVGLPFNRDADALFDIDLRGDDVRHLVPPNDWFEPARAPFRIEAAGSKQGQRLSLERFDLGVASLEVSLEGRLDDASGDRNAKVGFSAVSDDLSALGRLNGRILPTQPLSLQAELSGNTRRFTIAGIEGLLAGSDITGSIEADLALEKPVFTIEARSKLLDLRPFLPGDADAGADDRAVAEDRLIPDTPLPLDRLDIADITFGLRVDELRLAKNTALDFVLEGESTSGSLLIPRLSWAGVQGGQQRAALSVEPVEGGPARVRLDMDADDVVFGYSGLTGGQLHTTPKMDISIHVEGNGNDLRTLAGSVNGEILLLSAGGTLPDVQLSLLDTFILDEVLKLILARRDDEGKDLALHCAAAVFEISDGLVETNPAIALTTDKIHLVAKGTLNLQKETLKYNFTATPTNALKISASEMFNPYILVGGTLAKPEVGIDPARALIHGGAAVGTSGVSILAKALLDRVGATAPLCKKMLEEHRPSENTQ